MKKVTFKYDIKKDIENCLYIMGKSRYPNLSWINEDFYKSHNKLNSKNLYIFINDFLLKNKINIEEKINFFSKDWESIEDRVFEKINKIFNTNLKRKKFTIYLTINNMCSFNIDESYFFIHIDSSQYRQIMFHELLHFFTWDMFGEKLIKEKYSEDKYHIIQESLTALINIEFEDLLEGAKDFGYPEHKKIRWFVREEWKKEKNIKAIVDKLIKQIK